MVRKDTELPNDILVRPLQEKDLAAADRVVRLAFGTFLNLPDPSTFMGDAAYVRTRWLADPSAAFAAELEQMIVGSNFATNWGSVGFFGPLTVHPDLWDRGVAKRLMEPVLECFDRWNTRHAGLYTFAHSQKHVGLYQKFGFWPRFITAIMSRQVQGTDGGSRWSRLSALSKDSQEASIAACRELTDRIYEGLDVAQEIRSVIRQALGETLLLWDGSQVSGFAVCHAGPGTEAGSGTCYIKFAAVRPGAAAESAFARLLEASDQWAGRQNCTRIVAGVNTSRSEAYRQLLAMGFRTGIQGVAMQRPNEPGYNRPGVYIIDDWR